LPDDGRRRWYAQHLEHHEQNMHADVCRAAAAALQRADKYLVLLVAILLLDLKGQYKQVSR
jgi:hypothetical protein